MIRYQAWPTRNSRLKPLLSCAWAAQGDKATASGYWAEYRIWKDEYNHWADRAVASGCWFRRPRNTPVIAQEVEQALAALSERKRARPPRRAIIYVPSLRPGDHAVVLRLSILAI